MLHCTRGSDQIHTQEKEIQKRQNDCLRKPYKELRKKREVKGKGEKERYIHLIAEYQRIQGEIRKPPSVINAKK